MGLALLLAVMVFPGPDSPLSVDDDVAPAEEEAPPKDLRGLLEEQGITLAPVYTYDLSKVTRGGVERRTTGRGLLAVDLDMDGASIGFERLYLGSQLLIQAGRDGSKATGDLQAFDNVDSKNFSTIHQLWAEYRGEGIALKLGKFDANEEFAFVEAGAEFLHSSMGWSPTIPGFPSYPDASVGARLLLESSTGGSFSVAMMDGSAQSGISPGLHGARPLFADPSDLFWIGEAGQRWTWGGHQGRAAAGYSYHTGHFDDFDGGRRKKRGGFHGVLEQWILSDPEDPNRGIALFGQFGEADGDTSPFVNHVGAGLRWGGPLPGRERDVLGFGMSRVELSGRDGAGFRDAHETAWELFYRVQIGQRLAITLDAQYIQDPGGMELDDATVITARFEWAL